ncbi:MAG: hypothetical protein K6G29_05270 [Clostridiales bacterium]|nr:hypothetical protein [Clostridiales bacterium]
MIEAPFGGIRLPEYNTFPGENQGDGKEKVHADGFRMDDMHRTNRFARYEMGRAFSPS